MAKSVLFLRLPSELKESLLEVLDQEAGPNPRRNHNAAAVEYITDFIEKKRKQFANGDGQCQTAKDSDNSHSG